MHALAIKSHKAAELAACCGRDLGRAQEFAQRHGIPAAFNDCQEMIDRARLDMLVIATS
jgi:predicted dehydrogenase